MVCRVEVAARDENVSLVRFEVGRWLREEEWPADDAADVIFAVSEVVSNSVVHAYSPNASDGRVEVEGEIEPVDTEDRRAPMRRARIRIRDYGHWRPHIHERYVLDQSSGWGLQLIRHMMAEVSITTGDATGTLVELISRAVPQRGLTALPG